MTYLASHTDLPAVSAALALGIAFWAPFETRMVGDAVAWAKPMKFAVSFVVLFATLALVADRLSPAWREGRLLQVTGLVMATAMITEMGYMIFQAAQGKASHFNAATPFEAFMYYTVMAAGAVALTLAISVYAWAVWRDRGVALSPGLRAGLLWGFPLSTVLTLVVAGTMSAGTGHHVGMPLTGAALPLVGWSAEVGDLRPAHFFSLHAMQMLPLLGLALDLGGMARPGRVMAVAGIGYAALTLAVFAQALAGLPLIAL